MHYVDVAVFFPCRYYFTFVKAQLTSITCIFPLRSSRNKQSSIPAARSRSPLRRLVLICRDSWKVETSWTACRWQKLSPKQDSRKRRGRDLINLNIISINIVTFISTVHTTTSSVLYVEIKNKTLKRALTTWFMGRNEIVFWEMVPIMSQASCSQSQS